MAKKRERATAELSVELSRISAALTVMREVLKDLPDGEAKKQLTSLCDQARRGHETAYDHLQTIALHASMI
jgi:hypothetical protein